MDSGPGNPGARSSTGIMRTMLWTVAVEEAQRSAVDPIARWLAVGSFLATVMFGVLTYLRDRAKVSVEIPGHGPLRRGWILQAHVGVTEHIEIVNSGRVAVEVRRGYWRLKGDWQQRSSSTRNVPTDDIFGHRGEDPLPVTVPGLSTRAWLSNPPRWDPAEKGHGAYRVRYEVVLGDGRRRRSRWIMVIETVDARELDRVAFPRRWRPIREIFRSATKDAPSLDTSSDAVAAPSPRRTFLNGRAVGGPLNGAIVEVESGPPAMLRTIEVFVSPVASTGEPWSAYSYGQKAGDVMTLGIKGRLPHRGVADPPTLPFDDRGEVPFDDREFDLVELDCPQGDVVGGGPLNGKRVSVAATVPGKRCLLVFALDGDRRDTAVWHAHAYRPDGTFEYLGHIDDEDPAPDSTRA